MQSIGLCSHLSFSWLANLAREPKEFFIGNAEVEQCRLCQEVLNQRMAEGYLPTGRIFDDVATVGKEAADLLALCDGLVGGFPCQDS